MADELQSAYRRLEESRERLSVTLESLSDGVITLDESGTVTDANPAARRLVPWADVGTPIRELLASLADRRSIDRLLAGGEPKELHLGEGEATLAITASKLGAQEGGTVLSVRDISQRARLERMKDEFVLTASHELRSPLTSVQGFAELLMLERERLSSKQAETVEIILENTRHLVRLLNDLLDLARSDAGRLTINPVPTEVEPLVSEAVRSMRAQTEGRRQELRLDVEAALPQVSVEPDRIRQVLVNLLTNANEYCPEGATIKVTAMRGADGVVIAVSDDGPGIPPSSASTSSSASYAARRGSPSGSAAAASGWRSPSHWSSCTAARSTSTRSPGRARPSASPCPRSPPAAHSGRGNASWRAADGPDPGRRRLGDDPPVAAHPAGDGGLRGDHRRRRRRGQRGALGARPRRGPDLMLLDAMMPRKSGLDVLREVREAGSQIPVLIVSAHGEAAAEARAPEAGASGFLEKPIDFNELLGRVAELLGERG